LYQRCAGVPRANQGYTPDIVRAPARPADAYRRVALATGQAGPAHHEQAETACRATILGAFSPRSWAHDRGVTADRHDHPRAL